MTLRQVVMLFPTVEKGGRACICGYIQCEVLKIGGVMFELRLNETPCLREERPPAHLLGG